LLNILIIAAHPDDEVLGMGATIKKLAKNKNKIHLAVITEGASAQYENKKMIESRKNACKKSAKILGINKGSLEKGSDADLCIFDINKPWVVDKDKLKSKSKNTPIEHRKMQGQILKTFVNGEMAFERV